MKSLKEKFSAYWKKKTRLGKISDVIFIALIIALFIPDSRVAVGGFVNRIKSMIIEPSLKTSGEQIILDSSDFNWELNDLSGKSVNLNEFEGKVIFINQWATWCPPCVGEMPSIQKLYDKFKTNPNVVFLLISNDRNTEKAKAFIKKKGYTFPVYTTNYQAPSVFASQSIPVTFLISKDKKIIVHETGANNWGGEYMESIINELLK
jgi:thiol-disulfide isomerase/thioredoxin